MADNGTQAAVGQNEVGIEKDLPMLGHRRTEIAECSMQCIGERHSVLVLRHDQIVESDKSNGTNILEARDRWMMIEFRKKTPLGQDNQLAGFLRGDIGQIAWRKQRG